MGCFTRLSLPPSRYLIVLIIIMMLRMADALCQIRRLFNQGATGRAGFDNAVKLCTAFACLLAF